MTNGANLSLLVVGSVAFDDIDGPFGLHKDLLGGSASFFSVAASYFTSKVSLVAVVGDDFPAAHVEFFRSCNIDVSGLSRVPGPTFHWAGRYSDDLDSRESLHTRLGVFADFKPKLCDAHRDVDLLFLGNIDPELQTEVLEQANSPQLVAADTMNFWITGKSEALKRTLARVQTLMINDEEARLLAREHSLVKAAAIIREMGPTSLIIKRGDCGALFFSDEGMFAAPALPLDKVKDPTGAGDTFAGGFMGYLAFAGCQESATIRTAMIMGSVMASFAVEKFSLDGLRNLDAAKIKERFEQFVQLVSFEPSIF